MNATWPALLVLSGVCVFAQQPEPARSAVDFSGIIKTVKRSCFVVSTRHSKQNERVCYSPADTVFGTSSKDLAPGREVHVVGRRAKEGYIRATHIAVYNTDLPAGSSSR